MNQISNSPNIMSYLRLRYLPISLSQEKRDITECNIENFTILFSSSYLILKLPVVVTQQNDYRILIQEILYSNVGLHKTNSNALNSYIILNERILKWSLLRWERAFQAYFWSFYRCLHVKYVFCMIYQILLKNHRINRKFQ